MLFIISVFLEFVINIKRENHWARSILFHREVELTFFLIIPKPEIETTGYKKQASTSTQGYAIKLQRFLCRIKVNVYFLNPYAKSYTIRVKRINFVQQQTAGSDTRLVLAKSKTAVSSKCKNSGVYKNPRNILWIALFNECSNNKTKLNE